MDGADAEGVDRAHRHRQRYAAPGTGEVNVSLQRAMSSGRKPATVLCIKHVQLLFCSALHMVA